MTITFKNVGQGDSIILEWGESNQSGIGIIDCNQNNGNPILNYIQRTNPHSIEFIILSHPHYDHFSGMLELVKYCHDNNIWIKYFLQTSSHFSSDFIRAALNTAKSERLWISLMQYVNDTYQIQNTKVGLIQADGLSTHLSLGNQSKLTFLSPKYEDFLRFIRKEKYKFDEEESHNNPLANILSAICRIETKDGYILLTADTSKNQLDRISKILNGKLLLGQSPHHGSGNNHASNFWHGIKRFPKTPIVFSVGVNRYGHPSRKAIDSFIKNDYEIFSTNRVGWLADSQIAQKKSNIMNAFSTLRTTHSKSNFSGDKKFTFAL